MNPTLPVIRELVARGEQISYYSTASFARAVEQTGAEFCSYTRRMRMPATGPGPFAQLTTTLETLLDFSGAVLDDHLAAVRRLRPTHVMFDSFAPWGRMVAQLLALPSVGSVPSILINEAIDARYGSAPGRPVEDPRLTAEWCAGFRWRCQARLRGYRLPGLPSPPELLQTYGDINLVYTSRRFQPMAEQFDARRFRFVGPCCSFRPDAPPFPFEQLDGRPLVLVSLGTAYGQPDFLRKCQWELAGAPWQVIVAAGGDSTLPADAPDNAIVRASVPQLEILRRASAFVTHGGMNSVQEALFYRVPVVLVPQAADQFWIASRTVELGAGMMLDSARFSPGEIRSKVAAVISTPRYASAAAGIAQSLHAAGGAIKAAEEIRKFFGT